MTNKKSQPFLADVKKLREQVHARLHERAVSAHLGEAEQTIEILQAVLATEIACVLRYTMNAVAAADLASESMKEEFDQHADEERDHVHQVAERISQLGGKPDFNPEGLLARAVPEYAGEDTLVGMIRENLAAERIVCEHYRELIRFFADKDPTTRVMIEEILVNEEEHANDAQDLLSLTGQTRAQAHSG